MFEDNNQALEEEQSNIHDYLFNSNYDDQLSFDHDIVDKDVQEIATKCSREGNVSGLIKLELKTKIQLQKHQNGQSCDVEWRQPQKEAPLTPQDLERRNELRERNKMSARKHRMKKKEEKVKVEMETMNLEETNMLLKQTVKELESLKNTIYESFTFSTQGETV